MTPRNAARLERALTRGFRLVAACEAFQYGQRLKQVTQRLVKHAEDLGWFRQG